MIKEALERCSSWAKSAYSISSLPLSYFFHILSLLVSKEDVKNYWSGSVGSVEEAYGGDLGEEGGLQPLRSI